ncbi:MAG: quinone-dependent dihydroorotate dehydrogenase [Anaerolineales bacterium]|nr:quinone-dependent dihydroorotate dehydrogenase [Anaerolineales bacterium]
MYPHLRRLLFCLDPEVAHHLTLFVLRIGGSQPLFSILKSIYSAPSKPVQAFGLTFKNPVGLAAGYDKDAVAIKGLSALGFGHLEVGTVTPKPQPGNPKPRVFRLLEDGAVINRMGFPSRGANFIEKRLLRLGLDTPVATRPASRNNVILGVNLGKNKETPLEEAAKDYIHLMNAFAPLADYLTINISSPNTVGLRRLQGRETLEDLLGQIYLERETWNVKCPILVKIAPDLSDEELEDAIGVILDKNMDGIVATNTTLAREGLKSRYQRETGGLSGGPLAVKSEAVLRQVVKLTNGKVPIISVGGIMNPDDAKKRLALGASLVQVYTGLIYRGPSLVREIINGL